MAINLPACPPNLKPISHFLKLAVEHGKLAIKNSKHRSMKWRHSIVIFSQFVQFSNESFSDERDPVVSYWARLYALQTGLKLSTKQPEETQLLLGRLNQRDLLLSISTSTSLLISAFLFAVDMQPLWNG